MACCQFMGSCFIIFFGERHLMSGLKDFISSLFVSKRNKELPEAKKEEIRTSLQKRYWEFKTLLRANNEIHEIMTDMGEIVKSGRSFGMSYIRANCTAISVNLYKIIENLNGISDNRFHELFDVSEGIWKNITNSLETRKIIHDSGFVLPLEEVSKQHADSVGSKMANLGEIKNKICMPVPEGFVITASAYDRYIEFNKIQPEINRKIQMLDIANIEMLHRVSSEIQQLVMNGTVPEDLSREIMNAFDQLELKANRRLSVSMRSSALGEDQLNASFAGQYRSALNVNRDLVIYMYKEVIASKYTLQAISYRLNRGFRDEDIPMCVGCMEMVDAVSGGVIYSRSPGDFTNDAIIVNAAWGLAKTVVDGSVNPDTFIIARHDMKKINKKTIPAKDKKAIVHAEEGVVTIEVENTLRDKPSISDEQALLLAEHAERLEKHFGCPQDIEWSIDGSGQLKILQSRPLKKHLNYFLKAPLPDAIKNEVVIEGGITACGGVASGRAFVVNSTIDMLQFPKGSVLIVKYPLPQWASLLAHAAGVVTDTGGMTGHLATVAREFDVPALFNTGKATEKINTGDVITVDAAGSKIYSGEVTELLHNTVKACGLMEGSPVYAILENVLKLIVPLNLTDPDSIEFKPRNCRTIHDITRFCHEMSVREMFEFGKEHSFAERSAKRLAVKVPMQWWVLNLEDGFKKGVKGKTIKLQDITSKPMLAIWEGINAVPWKGPPPVDTKGFMSVMFEATMNTEIEPSMQSGFSVKNYFIISKNFCNLSSRLGFHFTIVEAYITDWPKNNYISFNFKGGAADISRRMRRVRFIGRILENYGFRLDIYEDSIFARLEGFERLYLLERLKILGYLVIHTRQIDMIMNNDAIVNEYYENFLKDISTFTHIKL